MRALEEGEDVDVDVEGAGGGEAEGGLEGVQRALEQLKVGLRADGDGASRAVDEEVYPCSRRVRGGGGDDVHSGKRSAGGANRGSRCR